VAPSMMPLTLPSSRIARWPILTASKAAGNVHPIRGNPGSVPPGCGRIKLTGQHEGVPDTQPMRLRDSVGWMLARAERAELSKRLIGETIVKQGVSKDTRQADFER
jgi:hypothetical protein